MNIRDKIKLSQVPIVLFHEGKFLKAYNHSFYIVKKHFIQDLKVLTKDVKSIGQTVIYGGFPVSSIYKRFPYATQTNFGFQISNHNWDLTHYQSWFEHNLQSNHFINQNHAQTSFIYQVKPLSQNQLQFLSQWKMDNTSADINSRFIQHLKDYLGV